MREEQGRSPEFIHQQISNFRNAYQPLNIFTIEWLKYGVSQLFLGIIIFLFLLRIQSKD